MRQFLAVMLVLTAVTVAAVANDNTAETPDPTPGYVVPAANELQGRIDAAVSQKISDVRVGDLTEVLGLLSIARQQQEHIARSARLSVVVPGLGQYINGDIGRAMLFAATDMLVGATTAILAYWLLPPAVQWRNLNYLQTPMTDIEARWKSLSVSELLPSVAVTVSGSLVSLVIRTFASGDAADLAQTRIADGSIAFEPDLLLSAITVAPPCD